MIAPDLLGHGESATPRGDYSLGAHASGARDVVTALGHDRVTVVGHSLGGGIAMQFAYQFPERAERLVLVSSGGLGRDVHVLLRAASLPGADYVLPALTSQRLVEPRPRGRRPARPHRPAARGRRRRARARLRRARQRRVAPGLPADPAGRGRARRPAREREQPARARRPAAVADRVGRERLDHPRRARARPPTRRCPAAASRASRTPATCPRRTTPIASPHVLSDFCATTEPAQLTHDHWGARA